MPHHEAGGHEVGGRLLERHHTMMELRRFGGHTPAAHEKGILHRDTSAQRLSGKGACLTTRALV